MKFSTISVYMVSRRETIEKLFKRFNAVSGRENEGLGNQPESE